MLPSAADLENIPEKGISEYYDKMLFEQFAVFWPRRDEWKGSEKGFDRWEPDPSIPTPALPFTIATLTPAFVVGSKLAAPA